MKPLPWSHSLLESVKTCPKQVYHVKIKKDVVDDTPNEVRDWGIRAHKAIEIGLKTQEPMPVEFHNYQWYVDTLLAFRGQQFVEHKLGIAADYAPTGFFAKDVWARCVIDYLVVKGEKALIVDHKMGKKKPSKQLTQNALLVFANYPEVEVCRTSFSWLKSDVRDATNDVLRREDVPALWASYEADLSLYKRVFEEELWVEKPSGLCNGWCPVKQCKYWRERKME